MQQPDSTVISEPSFKEKSSFSCDMSSVMSSSSSVLLDSKKPAQTRRSSVISVDYDSDHSDSIINMQPLHSKSSATYMKNRSPSTHSLTNPSFNFSQKTSTDLDGSDLFFSPKKPETVVQNKCNTPAPSITEEDLDDFYMDDFDIDDLNDSDIPDYFDGPPNSSTVTTTVKEGGPSKFSWEKKPTTPVPTPKPSKICSPGKLAWHGKMCF